MRCRSDDTPVEQERLVSVKVVKKLAFMCCAAALVQMLVVSRALAEPPDLNGVWLPDVQDQKRQETGNMPPWKPDIVPQVQHLVAEEKAGRPFLVLSHCLPHGMPSWMLITHNAFELLTTPGRITMLGEVDGNRMRRIYMDGRPHPEDPDLTLHGHSIGHWDGETLVIEALLRNDQARFSQAAIEVVVQQDFGRPLDRVEGGSVSHIPTIRSATRPCSISLRSAR